MPEWSKLSLFITAASILVLIPGPNSLGVQFATLFHVAAAAFGLSSLLMSSALAFNVVKYAGALYLIYLGIKTLLTREKIEQARRIQRENLVRVFYQGALVNLLNPKTALFFFAFLPQFVDRARGSVIAQILLLGAILVALGFLSDSIYALFAGGAGNLLRGNLKFLRTQRYFAGSVYIGLGAITALTGSKAHK
jgi:threonine/homoserine/homoserine lactone efflux protein